MTHLNLIVPAFVILALCIGLLLMGMTARDVLDDIEAKTERYQRHPVLAYVVLAGCFGMMYLFARLGYDVAAFCTIQLLS